MNYTILFLYLITWVLAFVFLVMWRRTNRKAARQETEIEFQSIEVRQAAKWIEYLRGQIEIDEKLLNDPGLRIVTYCKDCTKREVNGVMCKTFLSLDNQKKDSFCSEGTVKDA